jgi:tetratricopeptide (TPR) repeat protein
MEDFNQKAIELLQQGKYEEAGKVISEAIEKEPNNPINYVNFGNLLSIVGEQEKAINFFKKAISLDNDIATAYYGAGNVY